MILDNREQKELLMQIIQSVPISGDYISVSAVIHKIDDLYKAINEAEIKNNQNVK